MPRGGKREGAGRRTGSRTQATKDQVEAIKLTGDTPLEYLSSIYQDEAKDETRRIDAAKAAAPYIHARLSNVEMTTIDPDAPAANLTDSDLKRIASRSGNGATGSESMQEEPGSVHKRPLN